MDRARTRFSTIAAMIVILVLLAIARPAAAASPQRLVAAEDLAFSLLNCTRSGGWVQADGSCKAGGSGSYSALLPELERHAGVSKRVAFRWAREMVLANVCDHVIEGKPVLDVRFSSEGFRYASVGENVGCGWGMGSAEQMIIATHRSMQAEKRTGGWHWRNMKDRGFTGVGIGVAILDGRTTVVYDFYGR